MKVVLEKRKLSSGVTSLYLRYRKEGKRYRELLELYLVPGKTHENKEALQLAEVIRAQRDHEIKSGNFGLISIHKKKLNFFKFMDHFCTNYKKADYRIYNAVKGQFKKFLNTDDIPCSAIGERIMREFNTYLHENLNGESPFNYFKAMKRILKAATDDGYFKKNPADGINTINHRQNELTKDVLMDEEIQKLAHTLCGNDEVKRAFLFSTQTGLRKCDIIRLQWRHVFLLKDPYIDFGQIKTGRQNTVPLNASALKFLGEPGRAMEYVFHLPSTNSVNKTLRHWVARAGINKHITYHCARHSLGTNLLIHETDLKTVSKTLGHTTTRHTEKYTRISDAMKHKAVNKLPEIKF
jgi:integrase